MENHELISFGDLPVSDLMHYGVKGQRWGFRRYQNKDGSLTEAGKKRRAKLEAELNKLQNPEERRKEAQAVKLAKARQAKIEKQKAAEERAKKLKDGTLPISEMTDSEINDKIARLELERKLKTAQENVAPKETTAQKSVQSGQTVNEINPKTVSTGKQYIREYVKKLGSNLADASIESAKSAGKIFMEKKLKELLGVDDKKQKTPYEQRKEKYDNDKLDYDMKKLKLDKKLLSLDYKDVVKELNSMSTEDRQELEKAVDTKSKIDRLLTVGEKKK